MMYDDEGKPRWDVNLVECPVCGHPEIDHCVIDGIKGCGNTAEHDSMSGCPCELLSAQIQKCVDVIDEMRERIDPTDENLWRYDDGLRDASYTIGLLLTGGTE